MKHSAVFLDRDGTLNEDTGYVRHPEDVRLLPGSGEAVRLLNQAGFVVVLVTNQSGVARGLMTTDDVDAVNERLGELLAESDAHIDGIYYCPHLPDGTVPAFTRECECRKPKPGLLLKAAEEMDLDLAASFMVGDSPRDVQAGKAVGAATILIDRGVPMGAGPEMARSALEAAHTILKVFGREPKPEPEPEPTVQAAHEEQPRREIPVIEKPAEKPASETFAPAPTPVPKPAPAPEPVEPLAPREREAESVEPPTEPVDCEQCGSMIPEVDIQTERAKVVDGKMLCRDCHIFHQARTTHAREVTDADILAELKNIARTLTFEKFSIFNIFGGLAQAGAFAALLYTVITADTNTGLLLTIALQLMALTFFILGRQ